MGPIPLIVYLGPFVLYPYVVGLVVVVLFGYMMTIRQLDRDGLNYEWLKIARWKIVGASFVGALAPGIAFDRHLWVNYPHIMVEHTQSEGSLSALGALVVGIPAALFYQRRYARHASAIAMADSISIVLIGTWAVGRLICSQLIPNGGGRVTSAWYGVDYGGGAQVPLPLLQFVEYLAILCLLAIVRSRLGLRPRGLQVALLSGSLASVEILNQTYLAESVGSHIRLDWARSVMAGVALVSLIALARMLAEALIARREISRSARFVLSAASWAAARWRLGTFACIALACMGLGYRLSGIGESAPLQPADDHGIMLYTSDPGVTGLLEVTMQLGTLYVTPVLDVPAGKTVRWLILVENNRASTEFGSSYLLTDGYSHYKPKQEVVDAHFTKGRVLHQQLLTGSVSGPTVGAVAQAAAATKNLLFPMVTGVLARAQTVALYVGNDEYFQSGHLTVQFPSVGVQDLEGFNAKGLAYDKQFGWSAPLASDARPLTWFRPRAFQARVEFSGPLVSASFDNIDPIPADHSSSSVLWKGESIRAEFDARDLDYADEQSRRDFLAGILLAVGASAAIALLQERAPSRRSRRTSSKRRASGYADVSQPVKPADASEVRSSNRGKLREPFVRTWRYLRRAR
jgi:hypothetical protein